MQEKQEFLEKGMSELKRQLETEMEVSRRPPVLLILLVPAQAA